MSFGNLYGGTQPPRAPRVEQSEAPCQACGEPTANGADVDATGEGYRHVPCCDATCLQDLMERMSGGSQARFRFPSASDL